MKVSTVSRREYGRGIKYKSTPIMEHDDDMTQARVQRLPVAVLTDRWLKTVPGSDESRAALANALAAVRT